VTAGSRITDAVHCNKAEKIIMYYIPAACNVFWFCKLPKPVPASQFSIGVTIFKIFPNTKYQVTLLTPCVPPWP